MIFFEGLKGVLESDFYVYTSLLEYQSTSFCHVTLWEEGSHWHTKTFLVFSNFSILKLDWPIYFDFGAIVNEPWNIKKPWFKYIFLLCVCLRCDDAGTDVP